LAACVNVHSRVHSVYRWRGALEEAAEAVIVVKTTAARRAAAEAKIAELHSYELPSIVRVRASANSRVTKWFKDCVE
jgi:periplasmic divalent cation tolerance protein